MDLVILKIPILLFNFFFLISLIPTLKVKIQKTLIAANHTFYIQESQNPLWAPKYSQLSMGKLHALPKN